MPTVLQIGSYRFFFYASDRDEPLHVHVRSGRATAKFWLEPVRLAHSKRFADHELRQLERLVLDNQHDFIRMWHDYFGT